MNLYRGDGTIKAHYEYDSWGRVLSVTDENGNPITAKDNIGHVNPIRYRGYYYDTDTGLYYLKSRYYDPELGRFINADGYVSTGQGVLSNNMFGYCGNNPISRTDPTGKFWKELWDGVKSTWNNVKEWVKNSFGASASVVHQTKREQEHAVGGVSAFVSLKTGTKETKTISKVGDSSKMFSAYAVGRSDNYLLSSAGLKLNVSNFTLNISLGLDDIGISGTIHNGDMSQSFGATADLTQLKVGFEHSVTTVAPWDPNTSITEFTNCSITGLGILYVFEVLTFGSPVTAPAVG